MGTRHQRSIALKSTEREVQFRGSQNCKRGYSSPRVHKHTVAAMAGASNNLHVAIAEHLGSLQADDVADAKALDDAKTALRSECCHA
jgi:hypothetical protein